MRRAGDRQSDRAATAEAIARERDHRDAGARFLRMRGEHERRQACSRVLFGDALIDSFFEARRLRPARKGRGSAPATHAWVTVQLAGRIESRASPKGRRSPCDLCILARACRIEGPRGRRPRKRAHHLEDGGGATSAHRSGSSTRGASAFSSSRAAARRLRARAGSPPSIRTSTTRTRRSQHSPEPGGPSRPPSWGSRRQGFSDDGAVAARSRSMNT